ncbi:hypothetical protein QO011_000211 [Labrys wisconsinensis]|jgi:hypothetical protein|uniref:Uncharacterized protein n=1 Tax=Labrys wisconsinensis TaxID=425677 RepID=A0ABU0IYY2_9HYPH|nr:hypothetical protein [Labrys wisconsinensis]
MTDQELFVYQSNQAILAQRRAQESAQFDAQLAAGNQALAAARYPQMAMPITPPGGNQVRCLSTGFYTNCRY